MPDEALKNFADAIRQMTHNKQYAEALKFFKEHKMTMNNNDMEKMDTLMADIMRSLTEMKYYNAVLKFARQFHIDISPETSERILQQYGWNLYYAYNDLIHHRKSMQGHCRIEERELKWELVQFVRATTHHQDVYVRMVINIYINVILKREIKKKNPSYTFVIDFCEAVNPKLLDTKCFETEVWIKGKQRKVELQSAKENYYAIYTKALLHEREADRCIEKINGAFAEGLKFHFDLDIWFYYRMAEAEIIRTHFDNAIKIIEEKVLPKKKEWFVYKTMAQCYFNKCENQQALSQALIALEQRGELKYKTELLYLIVNIYLHLREKKKEAKVAVLGRRILQQEGWHENYYYEMVKSDLPNLDHLSNRELCRIIAAEIKETIKDLERQKRNGATN